MFARRAPRLPDPRPDYLPFRAGLDLVTPVIQTVPGSLRDTQNIEIGVNGGYEYCLGYERFDGQTAPSSATYATADVTITGAISAGDTITGATSGATAVVLTVVDDDTDSLVVTKVSGTFESGGESITVGGVTQGSIAAAPATDVAPTNKLHAQYTALAANEYRNDIGAVPGSGDVLGVFMLDDVRYAFRNNSGGSATDLYKNSASGWTQVALGRELSFTSGSTEISEGDTIVGDTSSAEADVTRVVLESGSWDAGTAAGRLIFSSQTGTFQSEDLDIDGGSSGVATIAGDSSAITMLPDGRFEVVIHNFGGEDGEERVYGVDGVNRGWEFDGSVFVPIETGMTTDTPEHVAVHAQHLFFSFAGSAQHSGTGTPYIWSPIFGAGELAVGDTITAFSNETGPDGSPALGIYSESSIHTLYGTSSANWLLVRHRGEIGARAYSPGQIGTTLFMSNRGITSPAATRSKGNFQDAMLSRLIQPFLISRRNQVTAACIARDKNQYRIFFADKYAIYVTVESNKIIGMMPQLFAHKVTCVFSAEDSSGNEVIMFGSDDGYVRQMEKGTSFDGQDIERFFKLHFHHSKSPRVSKSYKGCSLEVSGPSYAEFDFTYELGYASDGTPQPTATTQTLNFAAPRWDEFTWDNFVWDGRSLVPSNIKLNGTAENISLIIRSNADYFGVLKFSGALLRIIPRRQLRE